MLEFLVIWLQSISLLLKASYHLPYSLVLRLPRRIPLSKRLFRHLYDDKGSKEEREDDGLIDG